MNYAKFLNPVLDYWFGTDPFEVDDIEVQREVKELRTIFYCCNCHRHMDTKHRVLIKNRQQPRCIDCHKIILKKNTCK